MTITSSKLGANYYRLMSSSVISNLGDGIAGIAYPWLASAVTRDAWHIAAIGMMPRLPWLLFTLPAGVITDRVDRRKLIVGTHIFRFLLTLTVAVIVLSFGSSLADPADIASGAAIAPDNSWVFLLTLYVSGFLFGSAEVLADNAGQTLMPSVVEAEHLEKANGRLWGFEGVANSFIGPPLGGLLIALGFSIPFFADAASFALAAVLMIMMTGSYRSKRSEPSDKIEWKSEIAEGVRWLWNHRLLRVMGLILGVMNAMLTLSMATVVLFVQEVLGIDASTFGVLLTAGAVGGIIGSFAAPKVSKRLGSGTALFVVLFGMIAQLALIGSTSSWLVVYVLMAVGSFLGVVWNVITVSLRQSIIPDELLGRVNSVYRLFAWGMMPIGAILAGAVVSVTESVSTRELALRMPFFVAAIVFLGLFFYALPNLTTAKMEAARAEGAKTPTSGQ